MRVWPQAGQIEARQARALAWLVSLSRYRAIDTLRGRNAWVGLEAVSEVSVSAARTESTLTQPALQRCLNLLSVDQRHCLALAYRHSLAQDNVAPLAYPSGTVKRWVRRALTSLRGCRDS